MAIPVIAQPQNNPGPGGQGPAARAPEVFAVASSSAPTTTKQMYDAQSHKWNPDYIFPKEYRVRLHLRGAQPTQQKPVEWTVESVQKKFPPIKAMDYGLNRVIPAFPPGVLITIPEPDELHITAQFGRSRYDQKSFDMRDYLIVSFGDSFSSGQGNPDQPGIPNPAASALCELTTLKALVPAFINKVEEIPAIGDAVEIAGDIVDDLIDGLGGAIEFFTGTDPTPHMEVEATWMEPLAWRSSLAAPFQAAQKINESSVARLVTFLSFAQSGAEIDEGLIKPQRTSISSKGQIREAAAAITAMRNIRDHRGGRTVTKRVRTDRRVDMVVLSIGGNDVGFSGTLSDIATEQNLIGLITSGRAGSRANALAAVQQQLNALPAKLDTLALELTNRLNPRAVLLLEYPIGMFDGDDKTPKAGCGVFEAAAGYIGISKKDAEEITKFGKKLNATLKAAAAKHGWVWVDGIANDFAGHGYCSSSSWWVFAEQSCKRQDDLEGTMHPNTAGTLAVAKRIAAAAEKELTALEANDVTAGRRS